jgi:hypothetical protein
MDNSGDETPENVGETHVMEETELALVVEHTLGVMPSCVCSISDREKIKTNKKRNGAF